MENGTDAESRALPLLTGGAPRERADATRNRRKVLAAAQEVFAARGVAAVTMDDIAAAAAVGKGTLYRRFGDKSGLAAALLDDREADLQEAMLTGPPPLGPGAGPQDRLAAFVAAYLTFVDTHLDLVAMSQTASPGARLRVGSHRFWRRHCRLLLDAAGADHSDVAADTLLAALAAEQVAQWRREERSLPELTGAVVAISRQLCVPAAP